MTNRITERKLRRIIRSEIKKNNLVKEGIISTLAKKFFGLNLIDIKRGDGRAFWQAATQGGYLSELGMQAFAFEGAEGLAERCGAAWMGPMKDDMRNNGTLDKFRSDHPEFDYLFGRY